MVIEKLSVDAELGTFGLLTFPVIKIVLVNIENSCRFYLVILTGGRLFQSWALSVFFNFFDNKK